MNTALVAAAMVVSGGISIGIAGVMIAQLARIDRAGRAAILACDLLAVLAVVTGAQIVVGIIVAAVRP